MDNDGAVKMEDRGGSGQESYAAYMAYEDILREHYFIAPSDDFFSFSVSILVLQLIVCKD